MIGTGSGNSIGEDIKDAEGSTSITDGFLDFAGDTVNIVTGFGFRCITINVLFGRSLGICFGVRIGVILGGFWFFVMSSGEIGISISGVNFIVDDFVGIFSINCRVVGVFVIFVEITAETEFVCDALEGLIEEVSDASAFGGFVS